MSQKNAFLKQQKNSWGGAPMETTTTKRMAPNQTNQKTRKAQIKKATKMAAVKVSKTSHQARTTKPQKRNLERTEQVLPKRGKSSKTSNKNNLVLWISCRHQPHSTSQQIYILAGYAHLVLFFMPTTQCLSQLYLYSHTPTQSLFISRFRTQIHPKSMIHNK